MQRGAVFVGEMTINIDLPNPDIEILPNVQWGAIEAFPSPAYWAFQVIARRLDGNSLNYKLGRSLKEEVGACLLGGHGIPATVGLAAYEHLRAYGVFADTPMSEETIFSLLSSPLSVNDRKIKYRFARQKSKYLAASLKVIHDAEIPSQSGKALRNWLIQLPGIGLKTASWVSRNWMDADDVAILDIHLLRAGRLGGFFPAELTIEKNYLELEEAYLRFCTAIDLRPSELDAVIWYEMMSSPQTVHELLNPEATVRKGKVRSTGTNNRHANANQLALIV